MAATLGQGVDVHGDVRRACPGTSPAWAAGRRSPTDSTSRPGQAWLEERAQAWRPYRTWVVLLLRVLLETETGEIGGTRNVGGRP
jgi:hypothetical protein